MQPTLTSHLFLYQVHRTRYQMELAQEKRKAILYTCGITFCITISAILWFVYR